MAKKILITDVTLRDAHQSLIATRMTTEEMLPILEKMDKVGFYSLECWGGATFDACLRFLNEDPWDRLRTIREKCPNTKLQMLFRGQNMLGYRHYADDVLEYFVQKSVANGIDIIRIFDALNDIKNLQTAIKAAKKEKAHAQVAISYTTGPVFTTEYYVDYAKRIEETGADSICIKDMAALLTPLYHRRAGHRLERGCQHSDSASHPLHLRPGFHVPAERHRGWRGYSGYRNVSAGSRNLSCSH